MGRSCSFTEPDSRFLTCHLPIQFAGNPKCFSQPRGTNDAIQAPDQNCRRKACRTRDDVKHPVESVDKIDIKSAGWTKHSFIAGRSASCSMRSQVLWSDIGLRLGDDARFGLLTDFPMETTTNQIASDLFCTFSAGVE
jgi:hypothetical protein